MVSFYFHNWFYMAFLKKMLMKHLKLYMSLIFSFCTTVTLFAQGQEGILKIDPEHKDFVSISLQSHKGLPRFGLLDNYVSEGIKVTRSSYTPEIREKLKKVRTGLSNYSLMTRLKYLAPLMDDLDRERLTPTNGNSSITQRNSIYLQSFLRRSLAPKICLSEVCQKLGRGKNEFERLRNYKAFTLDYLGPLQDWAATFFKDDELVG